MKPIQSLLALAAICFLSSCETTLVARNNQAMITIPEGILGQIPEPGQTLEWSGGKNESGYAHGTGTETWFGPDGGKIRETNLTYQNGTKNGPFTMRTFENGKLHTETAGTYENNIIIHEYKLRYFQASAPDSFIDDTNFRTRSGLYHGERVVRKLNGERIVEQWHLGELLTSTTYNRDGSVKPNPVSQTSYSSSNSDNELLGSMFALGGIAGGNADLTMGGISMMAGDEAGAMQHIQNLANSATGDNAAAPASPDAIGTIRSVSSQSRNVVTEGNLVDKYGLGRYRGQQDHISHYLTAADEAYARYKQTGDSSYYDQHREYADLAKQHHQQTATDGTKLSR